MNPDVLTLPALVRGRVVWPEPLHPRDLDFAADSQVAMRIGSSYVVPGATLGIEQTFVVAPYVDPSVVVERDRAHLVRCLHDRPFDSVLEFLDQLRDLLRTDGDLLKEVLADHGLSGSIPLRRVEGPGPADEPDAGSALPLAITLELLSGLFDRAEAEAAVSADLDRPAARGRDLLDGWVAVSGRQQDGPNIRIADRALGRCGSEGPAYPRGAVELRAIPTRQLHILAGNAPVIPALSILRAVVTKGAAVLKCPPTSWLVNTLLVLALSRLADPITEHLSLVYWRGGDPDVEESLLADDAFDRVVAWGGQEAISSIRSRTSIPSVLFEPRVGLSLIGREAFDADLEETVTRAVTDSLIDDQHACTSSLVHYVETDEQHALAYCSALQAALARWDGAVPHGLSPAALGLLRRMRRESLVGARWFINGRWPEVSSTVIYSHQPFDLALHPMSRCIVVRRVDDLDAVIGDLDRRVAAVGVWPRDRWSRVRGVIAAAGVSTVAPLGEIERRWSGMPHDGMRPLDQLVNWTVA